MTHRSRAVAACFAAASLAAATASAQPTKPVYLQYDGYVKNADGTLTLSFGYFNMNNVDVTVQPGGANTFSPPPADRNQPIAFLKGRHRFACSMVVPAGFDGKLQWTVTFAGTTETTTPKMLDPLYELEENSAKRAVAGLDLSQAPKNVCVNRPPVVEIANPFGAVDGAAATDVKAKTGQDLTINGHVEDDGLPRGGTLAIEWKRISGPGDVTFSDAHSAATRVKFASAGSYVLELSASDGEKSQTLRVKATVANE